MKTIMLIIFGLSFSTAQAQNTVALKLENLQLEIAQTLSQAYQTHGPCGAEVEAYTSEIAEAVDEARYYFDLNYEYNMNTGRKFTLHQDVTKTLASTLFLKSVMNMLDNKNPSSYEQALNRVIMWGPAPGVYGNKNYYKFGKNNKVEFWELELLNQAPWTKWNKSEGDFIVEIINYEPVIEIQVKGQIKRYQLKRRHEFDGNQWYMVPETTPTANPYFDGFVDFPSECEA